MLQLVWLLSPCMSLYDHNLPRMQLYSQDCNLIPELKIKPPHPPKKGPNITRVMDSVEFPKADKWVGAQTSRQQRHYRSILGSDWCLVRVLDSNKAGICSSKISKKSEWNLTRTVTHRSHHHDIITTVCTTIPPLPRTKRKALNLKTFWWLTQALKAMWLNRSWQTY